MFGLATDAVSITGSRLQGFTIEFIGEKSGSDIRGLTVSTPNSSTGAVNVSQLSANKLGANEVQTITITAAQPPAPTIATTVTQLTQGTPGISHIQEIVIDKPASPTPSVSAIVTETTNGYVSTSQIRQLTISKPVQTPPTVVTAVTEVNRGVGSTSEVQQMTITRQTPPKPVISTIVSEITAGKSSSGSLSSITITAGSTASGKYSLSYGGRTEAIRWAQNNHDMNRTRLIAALSRITGSKTVNVKFDQSSTIGSQRYLIKIPGFTGTITALDVDLGASIAVGYSNPANSGTNEVQQVTIINGTADGTFRLGLPWNGSVAWTSDLPLNASAAAIQTAFNDVLGTDL